MSSCINKNSAQFQTLLKQSGLSESFLAAKCGEYLDKFGRFPYLDELPGSNSKVYLENTLNIKDDSCTIQNILNLTGVQDISQAQIKLNTIFKDNEIILNPFTETSKIYIEKRPITQPVSNIYIDHSNDIPSNLILNKSINKLKTIYGLPVEFTDNSETIEPYIINNGIVYLNTDQLNATIPSGYLTPVLLQDMKINNNILYNELVNLMGNEYTLIDESRKLLMLKDSVLYKLPDNIKYEIQYHSSRTLDSILMGESSIKDYPNNFVFNNSLLDLCTEVNSTLDVNNYIGKDTAENIDNYLEQERQRLIENGDLEEYCHV